MQLIITSSTWFKNILSLQWKYKVTPEFKLIAKFSPRFWLFQITQAAHAIPIKMTRMPMALS